MNAIARPLAAPPSLPSVLHLLNEDWQTIRTLLAELCARRHWALNDADRSALLVRLCARLYALSRIEIELLYPRLAPDVVAAARILHEQAARHLHAALDACICQERVDDALGPLADDIERLHACDTGLYPACAGLALDDMAAPMTQRRADLLRDLFDDE